ASASRHPPRACEAGSGRASCARRTRIASGWTELRSTLRSPVLPILRKPKTLLRVELDDELLSDGHRQVFPGRKGDELTLEGILVELQPLGHPAAVDRAEALEHARDLARLLAHHDRVVGAAEERGNVHLLAVDLEVAVA